MLLLESSGWIVDSYMGQKPMAIDSQEIQDYRIFTRNYWRTHKNTEKFGTFYRMFNRFSQIIFQGITSSPKNGVNPEIIKGGFEPAFHFVIAHSLFTLS